VLLLYTDGLVERRGEPIDDGLARLRAAVGRAGGEEDSSFADRVYHALIAEASLEDDIALLAVESVALGPAMCLTLDAHPGVLSPLRRTLERWLAEQGFGANERFDVTLAASEAAGNAIEHAYGAREATFTVECERGPEDVRISVCDRGRWRDSSPYGRGRGLAIMRALVDSLEIAREGEGTTVNLTKRLPAVPA
jgi:anti-sigma regulatory factor (Ser/Thr protein kinase)